MPSSVAAHAPFPIRVVVDANVFPHTTRWLLPLENLARTRVVTLIWSPWIIGEAHRVLTWLWCKRAGPPYVTDARWQDCSTAAKRFGIHLAAVMQVVDDRPPLETLWTDTPSDQWDIPIWTAAVRANAHVVISENIKDGPPPDGDGVRAFGGICYLEPDTFLAYADWLHDDLGSVLMPRVSAEAVDDLTWWAVLLAAPDTEQPILATIRRFLRSHV